MAARAAALGDWPAMVASPKKVYRNDPNPGHEFNLATAEAGPGIRTRARPRASSPTRRVTEKRRAAGASHHLHQIANTHAESTNLGRSRRCLGVVQGSRTLKAASFPTLPEAPRPFRTPAPASHQIRRRSVVDAANGHENFIMPPGKLYAYGAAYFDQNSKMNKMLYLIP